MSSCACSVTPASRLGKAPLQSTWKETISTFSLKTPTTTHMLIFLKKHKDSGHIYSEMLFCMVFPLFANAEVYRHKFIAPQVSDFLSNRIMTSVHGLILWAFRCKVASSAQTNQVGGWMSVGTHYTALVLPVGLSFHYQSREQVSLRLFGSWSHELTSACKIRAPAR